MKNRKRFFIVLSVVLLLVVAGYCVHTDGPYKGKVVELETGKPIEGVVIAAMWDITTWKNTAKFCDAKETVTDKNGEFVLPKGWCISGPIAELNWAQVVVFKPGYLGYPPIGNTYESSLFTGYEFRDKKEYNIIKLGKPKTRNERELTQSHAQSPLADEDIYKLPNLIRLVNEERKNLGLDEVWYKKEHKNEK